MFDCTQNFISAHDYVLIDKVDIADTTLQKINLSTLFTDTVSFTTGNNDGWTHCTPIRVYELIYDEAMAQPVFDDTIDPETSRSFITIDNELQFKMKSDLSEGFNFHLTIKLKNLVTPSNFITREVYIGSRCSYGDGSGMLADTYP